ncbi:MAG: hypothetical protein ACTS27_07205 [Phycisphaerales bacterium]
MILFPAYIAAIWIPAFIYRRTLLGFLIALLGPVPIMGTAWLIGEIAPTMSLMQEPWWLTLYGSVAAAIGLGAFLIACAPRVARPHECPACHYDLRGNVTGQCPECGKVVHAALLASDQPEFIEPPASPARADQQAA